jgi:hypothetical protein
MTPSLPIQAKYKSLYKYLRVLDEVQITKLRKIATGILDMSVFSPEEIRLLEVKIMLQNNQQQNVGR